MAPAQWAKERNHRCNCLCIVLWQILFGQIEYELKAFVRPDCFAHNLLILERFRRQDQDHPRGSRDFQRGLKVRGENVTSRKKQNFKSLRKKRTLEIYSQAGAILQQNEGRHVAMALVPIISRHRRIPRDLLGRYFRR
jgi:hypothetical protein